MLPVADIKTSLFCKRKLYLERVLKLPTKKDAYELKRAILHEALKYTNRAEPGIIKSIKSPISEKALADLYYANNKRSLQEATLNHKEQLTQQGLSIIETHKQLWQDLVFHIKARIQNTLENMHEKHLYGLELYQTLTPKITYNIKLENKEHQVSVLAHRLDNYEDKAIPYLLSRQHPPEKGLWRSHQYELALLLEALEEQGLSAKTGFMLYEEGKIKRDLHLDQDLKNKTKRVVEETKNLLKNKDLPERTNNQKKCERCIHKERCYDDAYIGAKQAEQGDLSKF